MSSNEDYLDSLLRSVSGESSSGDRETGTQTDVRKEEKNISGATANEAGSGTFDTMSGDDDMDFDDFEFPELARLFDEEPEGGETESNPQTENEEILPEGVSDAGVAVEESEAVSDVESEEEIAALLAESEEAAELPESVSEVPEEEPEPEAESGETILQPDLDSEAEESVLLPEEEPENGLPEESEGPEAEDDEAMALLSDLGMDSEGSSFLEDVDLEEELPDLDIADLEALMAPDPEPEEELQPASEETPETMPDVQADLESVDLMDSLGDDSELAEISQLLNTSGDDGVLDDDDDMKSLMESLSAGGPDMTEESPVLSDSATQPEVAEETEETSGRKKKRIKKEKKKKEPSEKGPGVFQKLLAFFMDEEEFDDIDAEKEHYSASLQH